MALSHRESLLATVSTIGTIKIWDVAELKLLKEIRDINVSYYLFPSICSSSSCLIDIFIYRYDILLIILYIDLYLLSE